MVGMQLCFYWPACHSKCTFHLMCTFQSVSPLSALNIMCLEAMRFKLSCAVKINFDWNEMSDYNGEVQFLSN